MASTLDTCYVVTVVDGEDVPCPNLGTHALMTRRGTVSTLLVCDEHDRKR